MNNSNDSSQYDVFISYNRNHDSEIKTLYYELTVTHNLVCWLDEFEIMPDYLFEGLAKGIRLSKLFMCCLSKKYCESQFCIEEIMYAKNLKKPIVVLMLEDLKSIEMGKINSIVKSSTRIPVYDHTNKLIEKSNSELYRKIIDATLEKLNEPSQVEFDDTMSVLTMSLEDHAPPPVSQLKSVRSLNGHDGPVFTVKCLPGDRLASGSADYTIKIWDTETFDLIKTLVGHTDIVTCLKLCEDDKLVSTSNDSNIMVSGSFLITGSQDTFIKIWDLSDFSHVNTLEGHKDLVISLKNLANNRLASASSDKTIKIWDMVNYVCMQTLTGHTDEIQSLVVLPNNQLASGGCDYCIKIWNLNSENDCIKTLKGHTKNVNILKQLSNNRLLSLSNDNQIILWDFDKQEQIEIYHEHSRYVSSVTFLMPNRIATGSWDKTIKIWNFI